MDEGKKAKRRALYLLERMDRTEQELRTKLLRTYEPDVVEEAVAYVKQYRYIDDERYAKNYIACRSGGKSRRQIEQELLYKKGIPREILQQILEELGPADERDLIRGWIKKKHLDPAQAGPEELRRFYQFLQRRGFKSEDIRSVLRIYEDI